MASTGQTRSFLQDPNVTYKEGKSNGMGFPESPNILCAPGTSWQASTKET